MSGKDKHAGERRLADMTIQPPPADKYYPPSLDDCEELPGFPMEVTQDLRIAGRAHIYQNKIVDFALTLQVRTPDGERLWTDVSRVDCAHSTVHRHQMHASGADDTRDDIAEIPVTGNDNESWEVVDMHYDVAFGLFEDFADEYIRTWRTT